MSVVSMAARLCAVSGTAACAELRIARSVLSSAAICAVLELTHLRGAQCGHLGGARCHHLCRVGADQSGGVSARMSAVVMALMSVVSMALSWLLLRHGGLSGGHRGGRCSPEQRSGAVVRAEIWLVERSNMGSREGLNLGRGRRR